MIIQGSNEPIVLNTTATFTSTTVIKAALYANKHKIKEWSNTDGISYGTNTVILALTEAETLVFPAGKATLEVKWVESGYVKFAEVIPIDIVSRQYKVTMGVDD